jgi:antitoxin MazE
MQTTLSRWGNSLGLRIPKPLAQRLGLTEGARVDLLADDDRIIIMLPRPHYRLEDLLVGMTPEAMHAAYDWGPDVGREIVDGG